MEFEAINTKLCKPGEDCTPGAVFGERLEEIENGFLVSSEIMTKIDLWIPRMQAVCKDDKRTGICGQIHGKTEKERWVHYDMPA